MGKNDGMPSYIKALLFLTGWMLVCQNSVAFELILDPSIEESTPASPELHPNPIAADPTSPHPPASFQLWWLAGIPSIFMLMGLGWLLARTLEQQKRGKEVHAIAPTNETPSTITHAPHHNSYRPSRSDHNFDLLDTRLAYHYFSFGKIDAMLEIMQQAYRYDPFDLHLYQLSIRMLSESEQAIPELETLLRTGLFLLRSKRPSLWRAVAQIGAKKLPTFEDWNH